VASPRFSRGDRLPGQYRQNQYFVSDWQQHGLRRPPGGYHWVRDDNNDFFLALIATGMIAQVVYRDDRDQIWRQHYSHEYTYNDDIYYRDCRSAPDPAGIIAGSLIGGLLGNAAGSGQAGATFAGVIVGGTVGAALTSNLDCQDRSFAYKTYYDGFNSGRPGSRYEWRNPSNGHYGKFEIVTYTNDPYGFRCADFTQTIYIQGRPQLARGRACRQPDGTWAIVG
jgi:surface antigen